MYNVLLSPMYPCIAWQHIYSVDKLHVLYIKNIIEYTY